MWSKINTFDWLNDAAFAWPYDTMRIAYTNSVVLDIDIKNVRTKTKDEKQNQIKFK